MLKKITIFILLMVFYSGFSQDQKDIQFYKDKIFVYQKIGIDSALYYADKILASKNDADLAFGYTAKRYLLAFSRMNYDEKSYVLKINTYLRKIPETEDNYTFLSSIYNILGNTEKINQKPNEALKKFIRADGFAQKNNDIRQLIKIKGNIASIKSDLGQTDEAIKENKEVLTLLEKNKNLYEKENFEIIYNNIFSNLGHAYSDKFISDVKMYHKYADSAGSIFNRMLRLTKDEKLLAGTYLKLGTLHNRKGEYLKASGYYQKSLGMYSLLQSKDEILNARYNLAVNYYDLKDYKQSKKNFLELSALMEKTSLSNYDYVFTQDYLSKIYFKEGNLDSAEYYNKKFIDLYKQNSETEKDNIAALYKDINSKNLNDEINKSSSLLRNRMFFIIGLAVLLGCAVFYLIYQIRKKKRTEKRLNEILQEIKNNTLSSANTSKTSFSISNEKEAEIMGGLLELEKKQLYLKIEFNQAYVAKKLGTNTTYLSQTINKYAKKSFSEYTNELRINYILKELSENKKLRNYTTQALADLVGYKSGISFARTFKEKTGVTPFQFIEKLNKDTQDL
ncbi:helix-turn-helix domain-containing protein [Chryseobacterium kwangjuense]|uniref:Helix-turn-helix domain-containing protein n=1 Tax=Chryseobacterium kwangjuense TaxID=267125 RepID=A0ABW9K2G5_9FLAO